MIGVSIFVADWIANGDTFFLLFIDFRNPKYLVVVYISSRVVIFNIQCLPACLTVNLALVSVSSYSKSASHPSLCRIPAQALSTRPCASLGSNTASKETWSQRNLTLHICAPCTDFILVCNCWHVLRGPVLAKWDLYRHACNCTIHAHKVTLWEVPDRIVSRAAACRMWTWEEMHNSYSCPSTGNKRMCSSHMRPLSPSCIHCHRWDVAVFTCRLCSSDICINTGCSERKEKPRKKNVSHYCQLLIDWRPNKKVESLVLRRRRGQ